MVSIEIARGMKGVLYNPAGPPQSRNRGRTTISLRERVLGTRLAAAGGLAMITRTRSRPVVISSANGHQYRNGGIATCVEQAFSMITDGADVLDALVAGVTIVELDPLDTSVGYGGLPNADGVVQLDACCMHGPTRRAGGVAALEGVKTPSQVARTVMQATDHHLLAGQGAQDFARAMGFEILPDLNTDASRRAWQEWTRRTASLQALDPAARDVQLQRVTTEMIAEGYIGRNHVYGTINCNGVNTRGDVCGVTTTSGLAWKIPGRVGDSPILGAGLWVDNAAGAAGSTGRGEANLYNLSSFLTVELLRRGMHPKDAGMEALRRIKANTVETRLLKDNGQPNFNVNFYVLSATGDYAGVTFYGGDDVQYAVCTERGPELLPMEPLMEGAL
jgi:N4-(beta-N-acetylglucosaminyl)-L-asparaginase